MQPINVPEPSTEQTVQILSALSERYAEHHMVSYQSEALEAAAALSARYLPDRFLPDKAIDLMDEAGAIVQIGAFTPGGGGGSGGSGQSGGALPLVGAENVAEVVSSWTGIPLSKLTADEAASMMGFESALHERVIGQSFAVSAIARALRRARVGLRSPRRPVASMIFCGPTGVGKTELAKAVAELYYGDEKAMVCARGGGGQSDGPHLPLPGPPHTRFAHAASPFHRRCDWTCQSIWSLTLCLD